MAMFIGGTGLDHVVQGDRVADFTVLYLLEKVLHTYKGHRFSDGAKSVKLVSADVQAAQRALTHKWSLLQSLHNSLDLMPRQLTVFNAELLNLAQLLEIGDQLGDNFRLIH